jgi:hypothetical protein
MPSGTPKGNRFDAQKRPRRGARFRGAAVVLATASLLAFAQQAPPGSPDRPLIDPVLSKPPDKNAQIQMQQQQQTKKASYEAANFERRRQIADDSAKILALATELKKEVDKTDKDTLSLNVIRKAEMIEKLAKGVREKMKLTAGGPS